MRILRCAALIALGLTAGGRAAAAQVADPWDATRPRATRESLQDLLRRLELAAQSSAYSEQLRAETRARADSVRARMRDGDFRVGDEIYVRVEGDAAVNDTFTVAPGRVLTLPVGGRVPLDGVLRSELDAHLAQRLARFLREPVVTTSVLLPLTFEGKVGRVGYFAIPSELPLTRALMVVGGPTGDAKLSGIRIERGQDQIWGDAALQQAMVAGLTLEEMDLRRGDRIVVPQDTKANVESGLRVVGLGLGMLTTVYAIVQIFSPN
jgi:protein involved in polysaccharide export with SLBB domain